MTSRSSEPPGRLAQADRSAAGPAAWAELLDGLAQLRREAGSPSLRDLVACGGRAAPGLSTVSETLGGRRDRVSWEFVRFFVSACRTYVERREPDRTLDGAWLVDWRARWRKADAASCGRHRPPGMPPVWNLDPRNPAFVGRDPLLDAIRQRLGSAPRTAVLALHGIGGVGKTQLAAEFAHRFAADYDLVWWLAADQDTLLGTRYAALAAAMGLPGRGAATFAAVSAELRRRDRWLLVFDNAEDPELLRPWLPAGHGHVLITSRNPAWIGVAEPVGVAVLPRADAVALLQTYRGDLTSSEAEELADALGDLPLALAQAGGFLAQTGAPAIEYLHHLGQAGTAVLDLARPPGYPRTVAAAVRIAARNLARSDPAAAELLRLSAFLAPEPVPATVFAAASEQAPPWVRRIGTSPIGVGTAFASIARYGLARVTSGGLQMHRLTQAVLRNLPEPEAAATWADAEALIAAAAPEDTEDPAYWPRWEALTPHVLALRPAASTDPALRETACRTARYLLVRGDAAAALALATELHRAWQHRLGPDDQHTLRAANQLGRIHYALGRHAEARRFSEDTYHRWRRLLGEDDIATLSAATNYAMDLSALGEHELALRLDQDILARRRAIQGTDHPQTLLAMVNLAVDHADLDRHGQARDLHQQAVDAYRRVLGENHPDTLRALSNLAREYSRLGWHEQAIALHQDGLGRRRRVMDGDHPETLWATGLLADAYHSAGRLADAAALHTEILGRQRSLLGERHTATQQTAIALAEDLRALGDERAAHTLERQALERMRESLGDDHPDTLALRRRIDAIDRDRALGPG